MHIGNTVVPGEVFIEEGEITIDEVLRREIGSHEFRKKEPGLIEG